MTRPDLSEDEPLLRRVRRLRNAAEALGRDAGAGRAARTPEALRGYRAETLGTMAELLQTLRDLVAERDRLGRDLEDLARRTRAVAAYRTTNRLDVRHRRGTP